MNFGEHAANPRNMKRLSSPSGVGRAQVEGDTVHIEVAIKAIDGVIVETSFDSFLCGFAFGLCSMLTERIKGLSFAQAEQITPVELLAECPGNSETKREYAYTAVRALHAAINQAKQNSHAV